VIDQARECAESGEERVILTALCGHGHFDMSAYDSYLAGQLVDYDYPQSKVDAALENVPTVAG
jgi:tryptophan synthase beta chain